MFENVDPVLTGETLIYTIRVKNVGASVANLVTIEYDSTLPSGVNGPSASDLSFDYVVDASPTPASPPSLTSTSAQLVDFWPGSIVDIFYPVEVTTAAQSGIDVIALAASVENEDTDGVTTATSLPQFDNDQEFTSISAALDLYVDVTSPTDKLIAGSTDDVTFTITFGNRGPSTGTDVVFALDVQLPDGVTRVEAPQQISGPTASFVDIGVGGVYSGPAAGRVHIDALDDGEEVVFEMQVRANANAEPDSAVVVSSSLTSVDQSPLLNTDDDQPQAGLCVSFQTVPMRW